jgi:hypothetical protein
MQLRAEDSDKTEMYVVSHTKLINYLKKNDNIDSNESVLNPLYVMKAGFSKMLIIRS